MEFLQYILSNAFAWQCNGLAWLTLVLSAVIARVLYTWKMNPLRHIPGPFLFRATSLPLYLVCYLGVEGRVLRYYHFKYDTAVLQVAPNSVSVSDGDAVRKIYVAGGGYIKDSRYENFDFGPVVSIFSARDTSYRDLRAKAVAPLFAPSRLRAAAQPDAVIGNCIAEFLRELRAFRTARLPVDLVDLCARLSIDVVTGYLLGECYGGFRESAHLPVESRQSAKLSANPFIFAVVAFSRFSLLPNRVFRPLYALSIWWSSNDKVTQSFAKLNQYAELVVSKGSQNDSTYLSNLVKAGVSIPEAIAQSKAIVFAGTDSTAVMLATILFHLTRNPDVQRLLRREIREAATLDPQSLPLLRAVVKEGLRLGMANPTRLTRVVPPEGLRIKDAVIPPGTIVGCAAYLLHHDPAVFPDPFAFRPERWLPEHDQGLSRLGMDSNLIAFGSGLRGCIGKNLAQQQIYSTVMALVDSELLEGSRMQQERIDIVEWFNGEIKGHHLDIEWPSG